MEEGMARMKKISQLEIRAGERVVLEPGGYHLMLMHPNHLFCSEPLRCYAPMAYKAETAFAPVVTLFHRLIDLTVAAIRIRQGRTAVGPAAARNAGVAAAAVAIARLTACHAGAVGRAAEAILPEIEDTVFVAGRRRRGIAGGGTDVVTFGRPADPVSTDVCG